MRPAKVLAVSLFLASMGLGTTDAQACLFGLFCHHRRQVVCPAPAYEYVLPAPQAPARILPAPSISTGDAARNAVLSDHNDVLIDHAQRIDVLDKTVVRGSPDPAELPGLKLPTRQPNAIPATINQP